GGLSKALNRSRPHDQGVKSAGLEVGDDRCPACDPRSIGLRHDQDYRNPAFHYRGTRSHRRREVRFRSRRLLAPALERALFFHGMRWQLLRAGKESPPHVNPNNPGEDAHHHAFMVAPQEFERALAIMKARGVELVKYSDEGHTTFPGRHAYFHDP